MTRITKSITIATLALALASQGTPSASSNGVAAYQNKGASYGGHMAQHKRMLRRSERSRRHNNGASSDDGSASQKVTMPLEQYDSNGKDETKHTPKDAPSSPGKKDEDCDESSTSASGSKSIATPLVSDSAAKVKEADSSDSKDDATNSESKDDADGADGADGADDSSTNKATTKPTSLSYGQHKAAKTGAASDEYCDENCDEEDESADNDDDEEDCDDEEDDSTSSDGANASTSAERSKATKSYGSKKSDSNDSDDSDSKSDASSSFSSSQAISTRKVQAAKEESYDSDSGSASKSASLSSRGGGSSMTDVIKTITGGFATFFYQGGNAGACGTVHSDSDKVVALQTSMYANGAHCGKKVMLKNKSNGKTSKATVADECPTCKNTHSVDLSKAAFNALAEESVGMFDLEWGFLSS